MNVIQSKDIQDFVYSGKVSSDLTGSRFLITGATGLIGSTLVHCLLALNKEIKITCPVRSTEKAKSMLKEDANKLDLVECELLPFLTNLSESCHFDYIVHCASPTAGKYMTEHPVETYMLAIDSTRVILEYSRRTNVKGFVYISSLEYYGQIFDDRIITEDMQGYVDNTDPRSSYPLGKRAAEYLCSAYAKEYGVNVKVARLTQTFGAGVSAEDNRVFAQFARSVINGTDIVLHTTGESAKPYCYTTDCISAILYILLKGVVGESYNVANQDTYISIKDMAEFLRENFNPDIKVRIESHPEMGYAPVTKLHLSAKKLMDLGWTPLYNLRNMYKNLLNSMKHEFRNVQ